jgi:uncharacterized protein
MTAQVIQLHKEPGPFFVPAFKIWMLPRADRTSKPVDPASAQLISNQAVADIVEVKYDDSLEKIDGFSLTVNNWDAVRQQPIYFGHYEDRKPNATVTSGPHPTYFEPGNELMLYAGYENDLRLMVTGYITSVDVQFAESGHSKLIVSGLNVLDRFRMKQFTWSWPDDGKATTIRDSDVAKALEKAPTETEPGLDFKVKVDPAAQKAEPALDNIFMNNQFPILFLMERARLRGYQVMLETDVDPEDSTPETANVMQPRIYFGPNHNLKNVTYELEWGKSLTSFHPSFSSSRQLFAVTVTGWDKTTKKAICEKRTLDDFAKEKLELPNPDMLHVAKAANREDVITSPPARTVEEAQKRAFERLRDSQLRIVEATGTAVGLPDLRAGRQVIIKGTGIHFDGVYTITSTSHVLNDSGYRTSFTAKRVAPESGGSGK